MKEIERANEFIEQLVDAEEIISESIQDLNQECPIGLAKKKIIGVEKNCKIFKLDSTYLTQNPYIKNIHIGDWKIGNVYLNSYESYEGGKTNVYDSRKRDPKTLTTIYEFCYFNNEVYYPSLGTFYPLTKWMGVEPSEINTFSSFIEEAHGKVLLMGCGLGYVAYMLSLKKDVEEVTIIELDPDVKKIFEIYLKPQMNNKINIFQGDAIQFLERENISMYQYCSVDIWHGATDMFPIYLKCLLLEQRHPETIFHYWLEEDLHRALENTWISFLKDVINKKYSETKQNIFTGVLYMQNLETVEDIKRFLNAPKRPIIKEWALQNPKEAYNHEDLIRTLIKLKK